MPSPAAPQLMIRPVRELAGISLRELARRVGVSVGTMSGIETGKAALSDDRFQAIARALDTTTTAIAEFARSGPPDGADDSERDFDWREFPALDLDPVLTAAIGCFVETGYHGATMRTIAAAAGISVPGVYHHYPNKQSLLVAVFQLADAEVTAHIRAATAAADDPMAGLSNLAEATVLFAALRRDLAVIVRTEGHSLEAAPDAGPRPEFAGLVSRFAEAIDAAAPRGAVKNSHSTARAAVDLCLSVCHWFDGGEAEAARHGRDYAAYVRRLVGLT